LPTYLTAEQAIMTTIKLHAPKELPEEGISAVAFVAWRNQVLSFLEQELINSEFISGLYATRHAKNTSTNGRRLSRLFAADTDKINLPPSIKTTKMVALLKKQQRPSCCGRGMSS
jgi:hypothetical protein